MPCLGAGARRCSTRAASRTPARNPGVPLGLALGGLAKSGRDKLTFLTDPATRELRRVGGAAHRRVDRQARHRDRAGRPASRCGPPRTTAPDRVFVGRSPRPTGRHPTDDRRRGCWTSSSAAGHPVIRIELDDPIDLAGEVVRWEVATAFAGRRPGHQPVRPAERRGGQGAHAARARGRDRRPPAQAGRPPRERRPSSRRASPIEARDEPRRARCGRRLGALAPRATSRSRRSSRRRPRSTRRIARVRARSRRRGCATTAGYGPRFLHSTGQLHKGGPPTGVFLQLTADHPETARSRAGRTRSAS